jgi:hypothetical protein
MNVIILPFQSISDPEIVTVQLREQKLECDSQHSVVKNLLAKASNGNPLTFAYHIFRQQFLINSLSKNGLQIGELLRIYPNGHC